MKAWLLVAVLCSMLSAVAARADGRDLGTLSLNATFAAKFHPVDCPPGTDPTIECLLVTGSGVVSRLGQVTETYQADGDFQSSCAHTTFAQVVLTIAGKGELDAAINDTYACDPPTQSPATYPLTITGGSGTYTGATGSGTLSSNGAHETGPGTGNTTDTWTGSVDVAGLSFDTTPPTITGATNRVVKTKSETGVRVRYTLTATDAVDGTVAVSCQPRSGLLFPVGHTTVACTATDTSGNTATARFTITVRRIRG